MAYKWSKRKPKAKSAIIIFETDKNDIFGNRKGMKFNNPNEEWRKIVRFFTFGKELAEVDNDHDKATELEELDYIFGPIADRNVPRSFDQNWIPQTFSPPKYQLCINNRDIAKQFFNSGHNVKQVILFCDN